MGRQHCCIIFRSKMLIKSSIKFIFPQIDIHTNISVHTTCQKQVINSEKQYCLAWNVTFLCLWFILSYTEQIVIIYHIYPTIIRGQQLYTCSLKCIKMNVMQWFLRKYTHLAIVMNLKTCIFVEYCINMKMVQEQCSLYFEYCCHSNHT